MVMQVSILTMPPPLVSTELEDNHSQEVLPYHCDPGTVSECRYSIVVRFMQGLTMHRFSLSSSRQSFLRSHARNYVEECEDVRVWLWKVERLEDLASKNACDLPKRQKSP